MTPLDRDLLNSPDPREGSGPAEAVSNQVLEDEDACDEVVDLAAKVVDLSDSNHKLRADNVAPRARIQQQLKSRSSFERKFFATLGLSLGFYSYTILYQRWFIDSTLE
jgi:hypothetical protein